MKPVLQLTRRFRVVFDDRRVVAHAGLVIPLRLADRLGFGERVNRWVSGRDRAGRPNSGDKTLNLVATLLAGGEFISDVSILHAGATLRRLGYRLFSGSRLGEWIRSVSATDIGGFDRASTEIIEAAWAEGLGPDLGGRSPSDPVVVDVDSTHTQTYGITKQQAVARNYQGLRGYHPLLAAEASTGQIIAGTLRGGNSSPANGAASFIDTALTRMRHLTTDTIPLVVRADSGFYVRGFFDACQTHNVRFSVTVRQFPAIKDLIASIPTGQWQPATNSAHEHVHLAEVPFTIKGTTSAGHRPLPCRLIVRRTTTPADTGTTQPRLFDLVDYHAFVTDQPGDPHTLWRRHKQRAGIEAVIRDLKHGLGLNHFPSASYTANQAWLAVNILTHNLCRWTNQLITPQPLTAKTLRARYFTIPGRITTGSRRTTLHLPANWPRQHHITHAINQLQP